MGYSNNKLFRLRRRRGERGVAVFVVVLVVVMLSGVGLFAVQSSLSVTTTSGAKRRAALSEHAAFSSMSLAMAALAKSPSAYRDYMQRNPSADCFGQQGAPVSMPCMRVGRSALENGLGVSFFLPYDAATGAHGSLGRMSADTDFLIEIAEPRGLDRAIAGYEASRAGPVDMRFESVTMHADARLRLIGPNSQKTTLATAGSRAELILGPLSAH